MKLKALILTVEKVEDITGHMLYVTFEIHSKRNPSDVRWARSHASAFFDPADANMFKSGKEFDLEFSDPTAIKPESPEES